MLRSVASFFKAILLLKIPFCVENIRLKEYNMSVVL